MDHGGDDDHEEFLASEAVVNDDADDDEGTLSAEKGSASDSSYVFTHSAASSAETCVQNIYNKPALGEQVVPKGTPASAYHDRDDSSRKASSHGNEHDDEDDDGNDVSSGRVNDAKTRHGKGKSSSQHVVRDDSGIVSKTPHSRNHGQGTNSSNHRDADSILEDLVARTKSVLEAKQPRRHAGFRPLRNDLAAIINCLPSHCDAHCFAKAIHDKLME